MLPLLLTLALAAGPSFPCARASTEVERRICASPLLSAADLALAEAWSSALAAMPDRAEELRASQREWLRGRDLAATEAHLLALLQARTLWLASLPALPPGGPDNRTGRWASPDGRVELIEQPGQPAHFRLEAFWRGVHPENIHIGNSAGRLEIQSGRATWTEQGCTLSFTFAGEQLTIVQTGAPHDCGFGANVRADGVYTRQSKAPPLFDPTDPWG